MFTDINISYIVDIVKKIFKKIQKQPRRAVCTVSIGSIISVVGKSTVEIMEPF